MADLSRLTEKSADAAYRRELLQECRSLKPDVFLTVKGVGFSADFLRRIKETGASTVMYYPDYHFDYPGVSIDSFAEYDLFVTTKSFQLEHLARLLGRERVAFVPHGYVDVVHRPVFDVVSEEQYRVDLLYAGNHSPYKQKWLEESIAALPKASVKIIGNRWRQKAFVEPLVHCKIAGELSGIGYAEAIQTARINIAFHMGPTALGWQDLVSTRTFEIPACKGFMLHIDNNEVREFFEPGKEIDVFSTPEELADKVQFYLSRPELRARMIERAYARAVPAYGYRSRAEAVSKAIAAAIPQSRAAG